MEDLRHPIGTFTAPDRYTADGRDEYIAQIEAAPARLREAVKGLSTDQLLHSYREGGWTVAQVVHHVADSHINAYVRFKLAVTADNPPITAYDETKWAQFPDAVSADIGVSLGLLDAVHARWATCLRGLDAAQFDRTFQHSALGPVSLNRVLALYAWHGRHHTAHITGLRARRGW
jgi:uncharacterized damage-inducible protein DinB